MLCNLLFFLIPICKANQCCALSADFCINFVLMERFHRYTFQLSTWRIHLNINYTTFHREYVLLYFMCCPKGFFVECNVCCDIGFYTSDCDICSCKSSFKIVDDFVLPFVLSLFYIAVVNSLQSLFNFRLDTEVYSNDKEFVYGNNYNIDEEYNFVWSKISRKISYSFKHIYIYFLKNRVFSMDYVLIS